MPKRALDYERRFGTNLPKGRTMFGYVGRCLAAISRGLQDGLQREPGTYAGSTEQVALFNAASDALRILVYGPRRS